MRRRRLSPAETSSDLHPEGDFVYLEVGHLRRTHGVKGEIVLDILTDFPERLRQDTQVFVGPEHLALRIASRRAFDRALLVSFEGYTDCDQVGQFRNELVYVRSDQLPPLPEGEYYHHQLLGLTVVDEEGHSLGNLAEILETGANDVYVVRSSEGKETLIPAIQEVILGVDLERGELRVRLMEWS